MSGFGEISFAHELMKAGFSPWWNPKLSCGAPLFAQPGLALGYPGTLLAVMIPGWGSALFVALHALLAYFGGRALARALAPGRMPALIGFLYAAAAATLGIQAQVSLLAAMAWLPWAVLAAGPASQVAGWTLLFSCAEPFSALAALGLGRTFRKGTWAWLPLAVALTASSASWAPALQAAFCTRPMVPGFPLMNVAGAAALKATARETRVFFDPKRPEDVSQRPVPGPNWVGGSLRPTRWIAEALWGLSTADDERAEQIGLRGASLILDKGENTQQARRLRAPFRAAFVSTAAFAATAEARLKAQARPFLTRPMLLEFPHADGVAVEQGATWTLLSVEINALGEMTATLPAGHEAGWLYASDAWYPGWSAELDGKASEILRAEGAFRALRVPAGAQIARFRYRPWIVSASLGISLLMLLLTAWRRRFFAGIR